MIQPLFVECVFARCASPKYDHVVETFPSDRANQSLHVPILPLALLKTRFERIVCVPKTSSVLIW
jgi:hypothetical protein